MKEILLAQTLAVEADVELAFQMWAEEACYIRDSKTVIEAINNNSSTCHEKCIL